MGQVTDSVISKLGKLVGAEYVLAGDVERYRIGRAVPGAAVRPGSEAEVAAVLAVMHESGLAVVPWGAGLHQAIGAWPARYDLALDVTRLDRVIDHEPADLTATIQAGARLGALRSRLEAASQLFPLDPPLAEHATLGGILASNLSGPLRCRYGTARDLVLGLRVAHADGTVTKAGAKVVKNATAYDIGKLYLGAHGTLGIILQATVRLFPRPESERGFWMGTSDLEPAQTAAERLLGSHLSPTRVELLEAQAAGELGLGARPGLLVFFAGVREAVEAQGAEIGRVARECTAHLEPLDPTFDRSRLCDFPWGRSADDPATESRWRASLPPADCAKGLHALAGGELQTTAIATVAHGVVRGRTVGRTIQALVAGLRAARKAVERLGGFLVVLDAPEPVREQVEVWGPAPPGFGAMQRLKHSFDPTGVLNPGRFVGGI